MPASADEAFYAMLDSIAKTENAIEQNKRIKEAEFAEDSREPAKEEVEAIHREVEADKLKRRAKEVNARIERGDVLERGKNWVLTYLQLPQRK